MPVGQMDVGMRRDDGPAESDRRIERKRARRARSVPAARANENHLQKRLGADVDAAEFGQDLGPRRRSAVRFARQRRLRPAPGRSSAGPCLRRRSAARRRSASCARARRPTCARRCHARARPPPAPWAEPVAVGRLARASTRSRPGWLTPAQYQVLPGGHIVLADVDHLLARPDLALRAVEDDRRSGSRRREAERLQRHSAGSSRPWRTPSSSPLR